MRNLLLITSLVLFTSCGAPKKGGNPSTRASTAVATKSVQLSWTASASGSPTGYSVEQSSNNVTYTAVATVTGVVATVSGLTSGHTYYFRVKGYNGGGYSSASNVFTITP